MNDIPEEDNLNFTQVRIQTRLVGNIFKEFNFSDDYWKDVIDTSMKLRGLLNETKNK